MSSTAEKMRGFTGAKVFARGFRPFFLSAGVLAGVAMPIWVIMLAYGLELPSSLSARAWHLHEMLFGYLAAVIAGFLLTAIPNWTGRLPVVGKPLAILWSIWLAGRIALLFLEAFPITAAFIDSAFLVTFAGVLWREILAGKNIKNVPVCIIISLLATSNIAFHVLTITESSTAFAERMGLAMIAVLISLIGGRIVPSFTRNWMMKNNTSPLPAGFDNIDKAGLALGVTASLSWVAFPDQFIVGVLFSLASVVYMYRISRWHGWSCYSEKLVLILHVGYLWLPVWFALMALTIFMPDSLSQATALHAISAGAIGTMTIAVVTRASLGHSGQPLTANLATKMIYTLIVLGAVLRISIDWLPFDYTLMVSLAGAMWSVGFLIFVFEFGPMLLGRR